MVTKKGGLQFTIYQWIFENFRTNKKLSLNATAFLCSQICYFISAIHSIPLMSISFKV